MRLNLSHAHIVNTCLSITHFGADDIKGYNLHGFRKQVLKAFVSELLIAAGEMPRGIRYQAEELVKQMGVTKDTFDVIYGYARDLNFRTVLNEAVRSNRYSITKVIPDYVSNHKAPEIENVDSDEYVYQVYMSYLLEAVFYIRRFGLSLEPVSKVNRGISKVMKALREIGIAREYGNYRCYYKNGKEGYEVIASETVNEVSESTMLDMYTLYKMDKELFEETVEFIKEDIDTYVVSDEREQGEALDIIDTVAFECRWAYSVITDFEVERGVNERYGNGIRLLKFRADLNK